MASPTIDWTKVLTHPLGLASYVLFLLFGLLARVKRQNERRWILPATLIAAGVVLFGGLGLAYWEVSRQGQQTVTVAPGPPPDPPPGTRGDNSPIVQGVQDHSSVSITYSDGSQADKKQAKGKKPVQNKTNQDNAP